MRITIKDDFDLKKIADSGQCFRWFEDKSFVDGSRYLIIAGGKALTISYVGEDADGSGIYELDTTKEEFDHFWRRYFDLELSYADVRSKISPDDDPDSFLFHAAEFGKGIRILNQEKWETLITFIISQRKSIPAIKTSVENLSKAAGEYLITFDGVDRYSFPTPEQLAALSVQQLDECGLGYRTKYIHRAAQMAATGELELEAWDDLSDEDLMNELLKLNGVGVKVANCTMLFAYHRIDAFPKDVWINRILDEHYQAGFPFEKYDPYNGIMQQYLFFYERALYKKN